MKFSNFLFPESRVPERDTQVIDETLREAKLSDELGVDAIWLAEHHFDGNCAYVDPVSFAAALSTATRRVKIGFAVIQASLHHPTRLAEQLSLLDNITKGRLIVGLGKGTAYNIYEYQGYDLSHDEAQSRFEEAEEIIRGAWLSENGFEHKGKHWNIRMPLLRPRPFTKPHPLIIRGASGEKSLIELGRAGRPFLMNVQSNDTTRHRVELYKSAMREAGHSEEMVARNLADSWAWRNVFVAETDAEAERIGIPAFKAMVEQRAAMRNRVNAEQGITMAKASAEALPQGHAAREDPSKALLCGGPAKVAEACHAIEKIGLGGLITSFRLGPMPHEAAMSSLKLFMAKVAPEFSARAAA